MNYERIVSEIVPIEILVFLEISGKRRGQGSLEYIMMLSAASIVILIALAMVLKLKGSVIGNIDVNGTNMSISSAISEKLTGLLKTTL